MCKPKKPSACLSDPVQIGLTVRNLRRHRHIGQAELGAMIDMLPAPICSLENGRHAPSLRTLCRIADALGVTANDILYPVGYVAEGTASGDSEDGAPGVPPIGPGDTAYTRLDRRGIARSTRVAQEVGLLGPKLLAALESAINDFLALEDLCGVSKRAAVPLQVPFTLDAAGAAQLAYTVRTYCGIGAAVVFDYIELFENHGLRVLFLPLPSSVESLSFHDRDNANAFIVLGNDYNPEKQLFRLAVELATIYLFTANRCEPVAETPATRRFAKQFASHFLMPQEAVRATVMQLGVGPKDWTYELLLRIKHRFGVSAEAFAHRLEEVGALDPGLRQEFKARIHAHYEATAFGEPDSSRRVLSRNGRLGDLILCVRRDGTNSKELDAIAKRMAGTATRHPHARHGRKGAAKP